MRDHIEYEAGVFHEPLSSACERANDRIAELEASNHILTAELRSYFQQYGWESTESILKYHGSERSTT